MFMVCHDVFPAYPNKMLLTLWLKTGRLSVKGESVLVRLVMFTTDQFNLKYGRFLCKAFWEVMS